MGRRDGQTRQARNCLDQFVSRVEAQVHAAGARSVLLRDASALLAQLDS